MTWRYSDKYVLLHLIDGECLPNDLIICKGFSFRTEDSLYVFAALSEMIPLVKRDAGTLLRDARDLLAGHFESSVNIHLQTEDGNVFEVI
jgi:hypothetical protein